MTRRACGARTLSRASRRPWPSTHLVAGARSSCRTRARCTVTSPPVRPQLLMLLGDAWDPRRAGGNLQNPHPKVPTQGRNELIARYIKLRTGKTRTRKQVSSHIQVLARRKAREIQAKLKDQAAKDKALQSMATMSSAQIISATAFHSKMALARGPGYPAVSGFWQGALPGQAGTSHDVKPFCQQNYTVQPSLPLPGFESPAGPAPSPSAPPAPPWQGRSVASSKLWMLEFSAFLEQQQDPDTADLNTNIEDEGSSFYGVSSQYESPENMIITCSTKVCSFGKQVVEKVETEYARYENGHYSYRIHRSPLCEYMINFIHKLKHLPEKYMMNSVLENFTILQVVTNRDTQETLLCIAYVFEVSASEHGAQHHIYRLVKE
ncbi:transcriptional enhancer factor TEF-3 isoform X2 [Diceros bicornis minor]|uniref:transcriptional enhancer factor TEF-3 isoform X2 n=1 Tax=Diceros bicornis minor TaxID=77932 RepID=UPI0026EDDF63|nr:transcriptional enhancer factor TEF-3 isoform X2 [Diceros bicornis minor]